jgi:MFS family permease
MLTKVKATWSSFGRDVQLLLASVGVMGVTFFGVFGALFNLYLLRLGHSTALIGAVTSLAWLSQAFVALPAGLLSHRIGPKRVMFLGLATMTVSLIAVSQSELVPAGWQPVWIIITRVLASCGMALFFPNMSPCLMHLCSVEGRDSVFSAQWFMFTFGGFTGDLLGGWLPGLFARALRSTVEQPAPYRYTLGLAGAGLALGVWAVSRTSENLLPELQEPAPASGGANPPAGSLRAPYVLVASFALVHLLWLAGTQGVGLFLNVYLDAALHVPLTTIGVILAVAQLASALASLVTPAVVARAGRQRAMWWAKAAALVLILPMVFIPHAAVAGLSYLSISSLNSLVGPMSMVFGQLLVKPRWRPIMAGAFSMSAGLGSSLASLLGGLLITGYGYGPFFLVCACFLAVSLSWFTWRFRDPQGEMVAGS